jgi:hypothetical protein
MTPVDPVQFGRQMAQLEAMDSRVQRVESTVQAVDAKLDTVLETLAEKRGERRAALAIAGLAGTLVSIITTVVMKLTGHP